MKIPEHKNCVNCGSCCGPIIVSKAEEQKIKSFVAKMNIIERTRLKNQKKDMLTCQFRDNQLKKCAIYPVRPLICKLFGVTKGMSCPCGNSAEINGYEFIGKEKRKIISYML